MPPRDREGRIAVDKKTRWTFRYNGNHLEDERYMQRMCRQGWAARSLTEGFWKFERCEPDEFCYRIAYLRGKSRAETEAAKREYAGRGIEFVSQYAFWAIFRSRAPFRLYTEEEELAVCRKIFAPMPIGAAAGWLVAVGGVLLTRYASPWAALLALLAAVYAGVATYCGLSYRSLIRKLSLHEQI